MNLYSRTVIESGSITHVTKGRIINEMIDTLFIVFGSEELVIFSCDSKNETLIEMNRLKAFSHILAICCIKPLGFTEDLLAIISDSGSLSFIVFNDYNNYDVILNIPLTRSGCRRSSLGHLMIAEPNGRGLFLSALEGEKRFILTAKGKKKDQILSFAAFSIDCNDYVVIDGAAFDVEFQNPLFAILEKKSEFGGDHHLSIYSVELGIKQIVILKRVHLDSIFYGVLGINYDKNESSIILYGETSLELLNQKGEKKQLINIPKRIDYEKGDVNPIVLADICYNSGNIYCQNIEGDMFKLIQDDNKNYIIDYFVTTKKSSHLIKLSKIW